MSRKWISLLLAFCLLFPLFSAFAEEEDVPQTELTQEQLDELRGLDEAEDADEEPVIVAGPTFHEPDRTEFNLSSPALYTCKVKENYSLFSERSIESAKLVHVSGNTKTDVLYVGVAWVVARWQGTIGYIKHIIKQIVVCRTHVFDR